MATRMVGAIGATGQSGHKDTSNTLSTGDDGCFVWDDTKITTVTKLDQVLRAIRAACLQSNYFPKL